MNTTGKIVTGFLLGAVLGAITTLLVAPSSGARTRKTLGKKSKKLLKRITSLVKKNGNVNVKGKHGKATVAKNGKAPAAAHS